MSRSDASPRPPHPAPSLSLPVLASLERLAQCLHRLRSSALLMLASASTLLPLLLLGEAGPMHVPAFGLCLGYALRKGLLALRAERGVRQLRREAQFVYHAGEPSAPAPDAAAGVAAHAPWAESLVLRTLRHVAVRRRSQPGDPLEAPRLGRLFDRALRALRLDPTAVDPALLLLALGATFAAVPYPLSLGSSTFPLALLGAAAAVVAEVWQYGLRQKSRTERAALVDALLPWTRDLLGETTPPASYRHRLLYAARPWFATAERPERREGAELVATPSPRPLRDLTRYQIR